MSDRHEFASFLPVLNSRRRPWLPKAIAILGVVAFLAASSPRAGASGISTAGVETKAKDFGPTPSGLKVGGLDVGNAGYWFPNFGAPSPVAFDQPVDQNAASNLPSWLSVQFAPSPPSTNSFSPTATSTGGHPTFNSFILPNGVLGIAGQLVDNINASSQQQHTIVDHWNFGPGVPSSFYLTVVVDSIGKDTLTPPDGPNAINSLAANVYAADNSSSTATFSSVVADGKGDAYNFLLTGAEAGGHFSIALGTAGNAGGTADTALGGLLFTAAAVPEPSSAAVMSLACMAIGGWSRRASRR